MNDIEPGVAEQALIGAILIDPSSYWQISGEVRADDFTSGVAQSAYTAISDAMANGSAVDAVTLSDEKRLPLATLGQWAADTPGASNIKEYAKRVIESARKRHALNAIKTAQMRLISGDMDAIGELQLALEAIGRTRGSASYEWRELLRAGMDSIEAAMQAGREGIVGAPTGLPQLDRITGGLHGPKLVIVAARPSLGKTALVNQFSLHAAAHGFPVGRVDLEMSREEIAVRSIANRFSLNNSALANGKTDEVLRMSEMMKSEPHRIRDLPIYGVDDVFHIDAIVSQISEWHRRHSIAFATVDHLQLVESARGENRNLQISEITRKLKLVAKRLDIPVILVSQLSRDVEKAGRKPNLADLRDSGAIEQDADVVIALHSELDNGEQSDGVRECEIGFLKNRGGRVGWCHGFRFYGREQQFREIDRRADYQ